MLYATQAKNEYYPFGMLIDGQSVSSGNYRYGYNGKENDNEAKGGTGKQIDYGARIYDSRVARFLSQDPLKEEFAFQSSYVYSENTPIQSADDGHKKNLMFVHNVEKNSDGTFKVVYDDKASRDKAGNRLAWEDNQRGSDKNYDIFVYKGETYVDKTTIPGKAGKYFRDEQARFRDLGFAMILSPLAVAGIAASGPVAGSYATAQLGWTWGSSLYNSSNPEKEAIPTSMYSGIGSLAFGEKGKTIGLGIDIFASSSALVLNVKNIVKGINPLFNTFEAIDNSTNIITNTPSFINDVESTLKPGGTKK